MEISIIIPMFNSSKTIKRCLDAIYKSTYKNFEVIVVDDFSSDNSVSIAEKYPCKLIKLKTNSGPANARNVGARKAKGKILFFMDSDVFINKDVLQKISAHFKKNLELGSVVGIYSLEPANNKPSDWFFSFEKFSNWVRAKRSTRIPFRTEIGAIKKKVFEKVGGFNIKYRNADVEDYEFGYRLSKNYKIILDKSIQGKHYFQNFRVILKNYCRRSSMWFNVFLKRKKFDGVTTTASGGLSVISSFLFVFFLILSLNYPLLLFPALFFIVFFIKEKLFLYKLALTKKGVFFLFYTIILSYILSLVVFVGVTISAFSHILGVKNEF